MVLSDSTGHKHHHRHPHDKRPHEEEQKEQAPPKPTKKLKRPVSPQPPAPIAQPPAQPPAEEKEAVIENGTGKEEKENTDELENVESDPIYDQEPETIPTANAAPAETEASKYGLNDDDVEEADLAAAEEKATTETAVAEKKEEGKEVTPLLTDERRAAALLKNKDADISLHLARRLRAESCYYANLKERGDLRIYTFQTVNDEDGAAYQHVGCKQIHQSFNMVITNFNNSLLILTPISLLVHHLAVPLGSINSDNADISNQKAESIKITGGVGVTRGLATDCLDGYNIRTLDCVKWVSEHVEYRALDHLRTKRPEVFNNKGFRGSDLLGSPPTWYFQHRLFRQLKAKKASVSQSLPYIHQMYWNTEKKYDEKQLFEVRKEARLHRKIFSDTSVRNKELVLPSVWRFPMKPEAETEPKDSHRLIPLSAAEQASLPEFGGAVMMLLTPDSLCLPPPKAKKQGWGLNWRHVGMVWICHTEKLAEFTGKTDSELLAFLRTVDPPAAMDSDLMWSLPTRKVQVLERGKLLDSLDPASATDGDLPPHKETALATTTKPASSIHTGA